MSRRYLFALFLGALAWSTPAVAADRCAAPSVLATSGIPPLPHVETALHDDHVLRIVAIGSSSTAGTGASTPAGAYPAQLDAILEGRFPGIAIEVVNKGIGGETVEQNLARLTRDVLDLDPDLVIWQIGSNDALRKVDMADFAQQAATGIAQMRAEGADVILMEPQFVPDPARDAAFAPYVRVIRDIGAATAVPVFVRHDVMKHWIDSGQFSTASMLSPDGVHMTDASYRCLAERLADVIAPRAATMLRAAR